MKRIGGSRRTMVLIGLTAVGALALTACSDGGSTSNSAASPGATPSGAPTSAAPSVTALPVTTPTPTPTQEPAPASSSAAPAPAVSGPAPGTKVKIGEAVQLPFSYGGDTGAIALAVTSIEKGDPADLSALKLDDNVKGLVPYYIHYRVTNIGSTDLSYTNISHLKGLLANGTDAPDLMVFGTFARCSDGKMPGEFTNGKSADFCIPVMSPQTSRVAAAEFWDDPYSLHNGITWK